MVATRVCAAAKINLYLRVLGRRPDGFHEIETVFHSVSLADELAISERPGDQVQVEMRVGAPSGPPPPALEENLVTIAARLLSARAPGRGHGGAYVEVLKRIPIGGGLAGGSADAAGALVGLNELWGFGLGDQELSDVGASVGSDVPFCLRGGTQLAAGRGERLTPLAVEGALWFVLAMADEPVLAGAVYELWDESPTTEPAGPGAIVEALEASDLRRVASLLHNDLETAIVALQPRLKGAVEALEGAGALGARVSGSGPTVYGLCLDEDHARGVAAVAESLFARVLVVSSSPQGVAKLS